MFFDRDVSFSSEQSNEVSPCEREIFTSRERFVKKTGLDPSASPQDDTGTGFLRGRAP